jgi:heme-degrading monooxygenase HmoA
MYSRVTLLEIDTMRSDVSEAAALFEAEVMPQLREQEGFVGAVVLATPEGKGMVVTVWENEEAVAASAGLAARQVERFATLYAAPPGREYYEVLYADMPEIPVAAR